MVITQRVKSPTKTINTPQLCEASFLGSDDLPDPLVSLRAVHATRGAAAESSELLVCAGELAPSAGAKWHHRQLQDFVHRQPE